MNTFRPILFLVVVVGIQALDISIDTQEDYELVQGNNPPTCDYAVNLTKLCKTGKEDPGNTTGFWSTCNTAYCVLPIVLGKIGNLAEVPSSIQIRSNVQGKNAVIRITYRHSAIPEYDVRNTSGWEMSRSFDLSRIQDLTLDSEIIVQLQSVRQDYDDIDLLDEIIFTFPDPDPTSIEEESTTLTATSGGMESSTKSGSSPRLTTLANHLSRCPKVNSIFLPILLYSSFLSAQ